MDLATVPWERINPHTREILKLCSPVVVYCFLVENFHWTSPAPRQRVDLAIFNGHDLVHLVTRFTKQDIKQIVKLLYLPTEIKTPSQHCLTGHEAFFLLLVKLAWLQWNKTPPLFYGHSTTTISEATNLILMYIYRHWDFLLDDFASPLSKDHLSLEQLALFAKKISNKVAPLPQCWGFIDCTIRQICCPKL
jgi:hypothetical protein